MDLIERQAAIDLILSGKVDEDDSLVECAIECNSFLDWAADEVAKMPSAPRWIPCKERLPKPIAPSQRREWFITSNTYGGVTVTCYEFEASPFKEGWQTDMTILAWMPLPKPPKGD